VPSSSLDALPLPFGFFFPQGNRWHLYSPCSLYLKGAGLARCLLSSTPVLNGPRFLDAPLNVFLFPTQGCVLRRRLSGRQFGDFSVMKVLIPLNAREHAPSAFACFGLSDARLVFFFPKQILYCSSLFVEFRRFTPSLVIFPT